MKFTPYLTDFTGLWRIERGIEDRFSGLLGRFAGTAHFRRRDEDDATGSGGTQSLVLCYREHGVLRLGDGPELTATRDYLWRDRAGRIVVDHADGRPFHDFDPADPQARHWCAPDQYLAKYDFRRWPEWRSVWTVAGPRKDYTMESVYCRS